MKYLLISLFALIGSSFSAQADNGIAQRLMAKSVVENLAIKSILERSALEVGLKLAQCKVEQKLVGQLDDFNNNKTVSGSIEIRQICDNKELDGATNTLIRGTVSSSRALIDSVEISRSGF